MIVSDRYQKQGIGSELLRNLIDIGKDEKLRVISADILLQNRGMQRVCEKLGFRLTVNRADEVVNARKELV